MIAAGFGDMVAKYTSVADWKLAHVLWESSYEDGIAQRMARALRDCVEYAGEIGRATSEGVRRLMEGLVESGFCMLDFGWSLANELIQAHGDMLPVHR